MGVSDAATPRYSSRFRLGHSADQALLRNSSTSRGRTRAAPGQTAGATRAYCGGGADSAAGAPAGGHPPRAAPPARETGGGGGGGGGGAPPMGGVAAGDDVVRLARVDDHADGARRDAGLAAHLRRERHLVAGADRDPRLQRDPARAHADEVEPDLLQRLRGRDRVLGLQALLGPVRA